MDIPDNFLSEEANEPEVPETTEPEKIKLGDKEYTQDELSQLVGVAQKVTDLENQYNTKLDKVWPAYGQSQNELKSVKEQMERLQNAANGNPDMDPESVKQALDQARKIGLVTKEDISEAMKQNFREFYKAERETDRLVGDLEGLEKELDGTDGRPKFEKIAVLEYMRENGLKNPMTAYKVMYESQLDSWKTQELTKAKGQGMYTTTQSNTGNKVPNETPTTRDNLNQRVAEALEGII